MAGYLCKQQVKFFALLNALLLCLSTAQAGLAQQAPSGVVRFNLTENQVATISTARGFTTRIVLPEEAKEAVCGDLYDATTGQGSFVIQRSGNDLFIKPVAPKAVTNLFVKTAHHTFSFDLNVVALPQAHRVVHITAAPAGAEERPALPSAQAEAAQVGAAPAGEGEPAAQPAEVVAAGPKEPCLPATDLETRKKELDKQYGEMARTLAEKQDALSKAEREIEQRRKELEQSYQQKVVDLNRETESFRLRLEQDSRLKVAQAIVSGVRKAVVDVSKVEVQGAEFRLDEDIYNLNNQLYLRFTVRNHTNRDFSPRYLQIELSNGEYTRSLPVEIFQYEGSGSVKPGLTVVPGGTAVGVLVFKNTFITGRDKLILLIQGPKDDKVARLTLVN